MIFRRLKAHVEKENWFAVAIDFAIVVIGVFIGLQVANWNEARGTRELEKEYLSLLARDLGAIELTLRSQVNHEKSIIDAASDTLSIVNSRDIQSDPEEIGQALMRLWGRRTLTLESPAFSELKSAGRLSIVRNVALRNRLMAYFDGLARTERLTEKNNDFGVEPYNAFLRDSGIGFVPASVGECVPPDMAIFCVFGTSLQTAANGEAVDGAQAVLALSSDDPMWTMLRSQISHRTIAAISNLNNAENALTETREISDLLKANQ